MKRRLLPFFLFFVMALSLPGQVVSAKKTPAKAAFNFHDADLRTVIESVSKITGKNFIIDPRVKGKVNIVSGRPLAADDIYETFLDLLKLHGYAAVPVGKVVNIVPLADAAHDSPPLVERKSVSPNGVLTRIYKPHYVAAAQLAKLLKPIFPAPGALIADQSGNTLIISAQAAKVERILAVIQRLDVADQGDMVTIPLQYADAANIANMVEQIEIKKRGLTPRQLRLVVDDRTNSILVAGKEEYVLKAKALIANLDTPVKETGKIQVVFLHYAKAKSLADVLSQLTIVKKMAPTPGKKGAKAGGRLVQIQADEETNALIIAAPPAVMKTLQGVIRQLDVLRPQVLIEAIIAEVSAAKSAELGVQWRATTDVNSNSSGIIGGTSYSVGSGASINQASVTPLAVGDGLSLGYFDGVSDFLGTEILNLGVLIRALANDANTNILSTPSLVTLDNESAEIIVGQNVPFVTGSYTSTGASVLPENPFQTIERRDIGVKLKVRPQINDGDIIRLDIEQEVSNLTDKVNEGGTITNNRSIKTSVMVQDGRILVLGGLISDDVQEGVQKVPILGSIPLLGYLFRYKKSQHLKQNLMVFLRPHIIRGQTQTARLTGDRYEAMRRRQQKMKDKGKDESLLKESPSPVLPSLDKKEP